MYGFVAYLDILGFSELVKKRDFTEKFVQYSTIIEESLESNIYDFKYIIFSDSLIINSDTNESDAFLQLSSSLSELSFRLLMEMDLPLCGCVSVGEFSRIDKGGNVLIAGSPLVDAYNYERKQDWIGIMMSPTINEFIPDLSVFTKLTTENVGNLVENILWSSNIQRYEEIPFTGRSKFDGFVIVPRDQNTTIPSRNCPNIFQQNLNELLDKLDVLKLSAPEPNSQKKYEKTMEFLEDIIHRWYITFDRLYWGNYWDSLEQ